MIVSYRTAEGDQGRMHGDVIIANLHDEGFAVMSANADGRLVAGIYDVMEFDIDESAD